MRSPDVVERRTTPRYAVEADVVFASEYQELFGTTFDVSMGGACIAAFRMLPVRTPIRVKLTLPQGLVMCEAEVRWVLPAKGRLGRMGIRWIGMSQLDREMLESFCKLGVEPPKSVR